MPLHCRAAIEDFGEPRHPMVDARGETAVRGTIPALHVNVRRARILAAGMLSLKERWRNEAVRH